MCGSSPVLCVLGPDTCIQKRAHNGVWVSTKQCMTLLMCHFACCHHNHRSLSHFGWFYCPYLTLRHDLRRLWALSARPPCPKLQLFLRRRARLEGCAGVFVPVRGSFCVAILHLPQPSAFCLVLHPCLRSDMRSGVDKCRFREFCECNFVCDGGKLRHCGAHNRATKRHPMAKWCVGTMYLAPSRH